MIFIHKKSKVVIAFNKPLLSSDNSFDAISEAAVKQEADAVYNALMELNYTAEYLPVYDISKNIAQLKKTRPEVIFNLCEGFRGKAYFEPHLASLWELLEIPYTGNNPMTLGISLDKAITKKMFESKKIPMPLYQIYKQVPDRNYLDFPLIAKPTREDASVGITQDSVIHNFKQMRKVIKQLLHKYKQPVLVERYIEGREFNISILGNNPPKVIAISEIDFSMIGKEYHAIASYEAKWLEDHPLYAKTPAICPADIPSSLSDKLSELALKVYVLMGGRDYGRVDMRVAPNGVIYVLEYNPNPDISPDAGYYKALKNANIKYTQFVELLINEALARKQHDKN